MKKNVSGQKIGAQMVSATDGSAFTGSVTVYVCGDAGSQSVGSVGSGACTHEGNGYHTYAPDQAETNYDLIAFTFIGSGAIPATVQVFTTYPQTGDAFARLGAPAGASVSADIADLPTVTEFEARTLAAADYVVTSDTIAGVTTVATTTNLTNLPAAPTDWLTAAAVKADAVGEIADGVWDEALTGATHNVPTSAGRRLRQLASVVTYDGTVVSSTGNTVVLDAGASSVDGAYDPSMIAIVSGTGVGQTRLILQYAGATRTAVVDRDWKVNPALNDEFMIIGDAGREHVNEGLAQTGSTSSTIKLNASASPDDDAYIGQRVFIRSGTGQDQARRVASYNGTTKVATVTRDWDVTPDATSAYVMLPTGAITDADIAAAVPTVIEIRTEMDSNSTKLADILTDTGTTIPAQISALNNLSSAQVTAAVPTASQNAAATLSAATTTPIAANIKEINDIEIDGSGTVPDPWKPA